MKDQEKEIQKRVAFKLNEVYSALDAETARQFHIAFRSMNRESQGMYEALKFLKGRIAKERDMPLPYDEMAERKFRDARDEAVAVIKGQTILRGDRDEHRKVKAIVSAVEKAMRW